MEVLAGFISGFVMGTAFIGLGSLMLISLWSRHPIMGVLVNRWIAEHRSLVTLVVPLASFIILGWGTLGALMGLFYYLAVELVPGGGLGSPNLKFTLAVAIFAAMLTGALFLIQRRARWESLALLLSFAGIFGWFLPWLAS